MVALEPLQLDFEIGSGGTEGNVSDYSSASADNLGCGQQRTSMMINNALAGSSSMPIALARLLHCDDARVAEAERSGLHRTNI
jgi:hypothetical protein